MLSANFPGLISALQPFSHPLTQLPLIIGLLCETYSRVSPRKLFLSPFQVAYINFGLGNSSLEQTPPYQGTHLYTWVKRSKRGKNFLLKNLTVRAGFEPGTPGSQVLNLTTRPTSPQHGTMLSFLVV